MKLSPFAIYFAGIGTVVTALAVGFGSAVFLTSAPAAKETAVAAAAGGDAKLTKLEKFEAARREEKTEAAKQANVAATAAPPAASASTLLAATIALPVDIQSAASNVSRPGATVRAQPVDKAEASQPKEQAAATPKDGVQGTMPFEGADNAVEIKPSRKPIAEAAKTERVETGKADRKRRVAQRKTREVVIQSRRDADAEDDASQDGPSTVVYRRGPDGDYRAIEETSRADDGRRVVVRTYEARSRGFGGIFDAETEDD